jgi:hypothetical protein
MDTVPDNSRAAVGNTMRHAPNSMDVVSVNACASLPVAHMRSGCSGSNVPVKPSFEVMMAPKRLRPVLRRAQHPPRLPGQRLHRCMRCYVPATRHFVSDVANRASGDARHCAKQMPRLGISVKSFRNSTDTSRQLGRGLGQRAGNFRKSLLRHGRNRFGHHRQKLAGGHSYKRQEVFGSFIFCLRLSRQFAEMFHHGIGIDLADWADLVLAFVFVFALAFAFAEQTAGDLAKPTFAFQDGFILHLVFRFVFRFVFKLFFKFGFQFTFHLVCHDESSSLIVRTCPGSLMSSANCCGDGVSS